MRLSRWFCAVTVAIVLAGATPGLAQDMPDAAARERVADSLEQCLDMWREIVPWGASAGQYAGTQGMREFLADMQEVDAPIVTTISRFITMCRSVGDKVEQSGRPCREFDPGNVPDRYNGSCNCCGHYTKSGLLPGPGRTAW